MLVANPGAFVLSRLAQRDSIEQDRTRGRPVQSGAEAEQRRLPAAGRSEDRAGRALRQDEGNILEHGQFAGAGRVGLGEVLNVEDRECSH